MLQFFITIHDSQEFLDGKQYYRQNTYTPDDREYTGQAKASRKND
jgi:hypothetical protein